GTAAPVPYPLLHPARGEEALALGPRKPGVIGLRIPVRFADDDRGLEIAPEMAVHHSRDGAIACHVNERCRDRSRQRHDLLIGDDAVIYALGGEVGDMRAAGETDRLGPLPAAPCERISKADRGLARRTRDQDLIHTIVTLIVELVCDQPAG